MNTPKDINHNPVSAPTIICKECREPRYVLTKHHMETVHGINKEEYIRRHKEHKDLVYWGSVYKQINSKHKETVRAAGVVN